jgi:ferredoxin
MEKRMQYSNVQQFYFSATGTTQKVVREIGSHFSQEASQRDMLREPINAPESLDGGSLVIIGVPVYSGRIPTLCVEMLGKLKGSNTPAIAVVVYGNRDYDDALLELTDVLTGNGFIVLGAGAFVAQHSIFPRVGAARPDQSDMRRIAEFSQQCKAKLEQMTGTEKSVQVKGNSPYKKPAPVPLKPSASKRCNACGACARVCLTGAISKENPPAKNKDLCISCAACIAACPQEAQAFRGILYSLFGKLFERKCSPRREPETFV